MELDVGEKDVGEKEMVGQLWLGKKISKMTDWWDAFPAPKSTPERWTHDQVAALIQSPDAVAGRDYVVVDVRRADFGGGTVKGAINVHAQTFYENLDEFVGKHKEVPRVFFFCNSSSQTATKIGRGPRCAMWYQDALDARGIKTSKAFILAAGIKGWVEQHKDDGLVEGYDAEFWKQ
ncbi:hypothetical protein HDU98_006588 [Podochytrium sp. JEL0797]|nr:hypothetical protein HDU98_006588 [Podochytrium sp. JEL0797]